MQISNRKRYIDILKMLAILAVIFCHLQLNDVIGTNVWFVRCDNFVIDRLWYIFGYILANMSIPMFILLTGANRFRNVDDVNINYKKLFKEILKIIILLIIFQVPLYIYKYYKYGDILSLKDYVVTMYSSNVEPIYWYFSGFYLAFLFSYPILKKFTIKATKVDYEYLFVIYAAVQLIINNISKYYSINANVPFSIFSYIYIYPLFGDLICNKYGKTDISFTKILLLTLCGIIYFITNEPYDAMNIYVAMLVLILVKYLSEKTEDFYKLNNNKIYSVIDFSARNALLFYLFHPYIIRIVYRLSNKIYNTSIQYLDYIIGLLFLLVNFIVTYIVVYVYKKFTKLCKL